MTQHKAWRKFDETLPEKPVERDTFAGSWINTSTSPQAWVGLESSFKDGVPAIRAILIGGKYVEFNEVILYGGTCGTELTAFSASAIHQNTQVLLQGNLNLGLLVLATFKRAERPNTAGFFSREFFARTTSLDIDGEDKGDVTTLFNQFSRPDSLGEEALVGRWRSADPKTTGIVEIKIAQDTRGLIATTTGASSTGAQSTSWGDARVSLFACLDESGQPSLSALASWSLDGLKSHLQMRLPAGTLAISGFNEFSDERMDYATREFFFRIED